MSTKIEKARLGRLNVVSAALQQPQQQKYKVEQ
jgi:hypothetical protein